VFERDLADGKNPEEHTCQMLFSRLYEALPTPVMQVWPETLWEARIEQELIGELTTGGDSLAGFAVQLTETVWAELLSRLLNEGKIGITRSR
jgi:hypothetical protein